MNLGKILNWPSTRSKTQEAAVDILSVAPVAPPSVAPGVVTSVPLRREIGGGIGIQGQPAHVAVSKNRARCEGCKEPVEAGKRHICIYNAHNHMATLTADERTALVEQLQRLGVESELPKAIAPPAKRKRRST